MYQDTCFFCAFSYGVLGWQWHQLDHMETICTSLETEQHLITQHSENIRINMKIICTQNDAKF